MHQATRVINMTHISAFRGLIAWLGTQGMKTDRSWWYVARHPIEGTGWQATGVPGRSSQDPLQKPSQDVLIKEQKFPSGHDLISFSQEPSEWSWASIRSQSSRWLSGSTLRPHTEFQNMYAPFSHYLSSGPPLSTPQPPKHTQSHFLWVTSPSQAGCTLGRHRKKYHLHLLSPQEQKEWCWSAGKAIQRAKIFASTKGWKLLTTSHCC